MNTLAETFKLAAKKKKKKKKRGWILPAAITGVATLATGYLVHRSMKELEKEEASRIRTEARAARRIQKARQSMAAIRKQQASGAAQMMRARRAIRLLEAVTKITR